MDVEGIVLLKLGRKNLMNYLICIFMTIRCPQCEITYGVRAVP